MLGIKCYRNFRDAGWEEAVRLRHYKATRDLRSSHPIEKHWKHRAGEGMAPLRSEEGFVVWESCHEVGPKRGAGPLSAQLLRAAPILEE